MEETAVANFNIGVLGHVDCGKTSLVKSLSTHLSTASLDKHPQSRQRGMTLDLGFSSMILDIPEPLREMAGSHEKIQFTFVDCPGHASLIKTIIGGSQIIDMMILVVRLHTALTISWRNLIHTDPTSSWPHLTHPAPTLL